MIKQDTDKTLMIPHWEVHLIVIITKESNLVKDPQINKS